MSSNKHHSAFIGAELNQTCNFLFFLFVVISKQSNHRYFVRYNIVYIVIFTETIVGTGYKLKCWRLFVNRGNNQISILSQKIFVKIFIWLRSVNSLQFFHNCLMNVFLLLLFEILVFNYLKYCIP